MSIALKRENVATAALLAAGFLVISAYFGAIDVYHRNFFDPGTGIFVYNVFRVAFAAYLIWIIGFAGYAVLFALRASGSFGTFKPLERAIIAFGTGLGVLHVLLLALGVAALYFRWTMLVLCLGILIASAPLLDRIVTAIRAGWPVRPSRLTLTVVILIALAAVWLLVVRGLTPGGSNDYFTHYFYYYLEVLRNHGLQPNDVWYHYYYSKGAGPTFLAMLLTDPEAPEVVTFCYVLVAGAGLATLCARIVPNSLWPAFCAGLYYVTYIVSLGTGLEFQEAHEETGAIVLLIAWALCMRSIGPPEWRRPLFVMVVALLAAAAILELPAAVIFGAFLGVAAVVAVIRLNYADARVYGLLCVVAVVATFAALGLNWLATGLVSDQELDLALRVASLQRLNEWGVVPQIVMLEWIRDNYTLVAPQLGTRIVAEWSAFLRWDILWPLVASSFVALAILGLRRGKAQTDLENAKADGPARTIALFLAGLIVFLALVSIPAAGSQTTSYLRFSWFFVPLIVLYCTACWGILATTSERRPWVLSNALPVLLFCVLIYSWQSGNSWLLRTSQATSSAARFVFGVDSLATAYAPSSGINPVALSMFRAVPPGSRIWSTNVGEYCMAPDCIIESVVSFKFSPRMDEILSGSPEDARAILQSENLNYFIFASEASLIDILPYSRLFAPDAIGNYLGIKWSNGADYLLTWRGPGVQPLTPDFIRQYTAVLGQPENPWFRFRELIPNLRSTMANFVAAGPSSRHLNFAWRTPSGVAQVAATPSAVVAPVPQAVTNVAARRSYSASVASPSTTSTTLAPTNVDVFDELDVGRGRRDGMTLEPNQNLLVDGWTYDPVGASPGRAVKIVVDGKRAYLARYGISRGDVAAALKNGALTNVGFEAIIPATKLGAGGHTIVVVVTGKNGATYSSGASGTLHLTVAPGH